MLETLTQYEVIVLIGGIIAVYIKLNADILKLMGRVGTLEKTNTEVKDLLTTLMNAVNEIKILLATQGIK